MIYRLRFEAVRQTELHKYCDLPPAFYENVQQTVPNSRIPAADWSEVTTEPRDSVDLLHVQYTNLKREADADRGFVRNPVIECSEEPAWRPVDAAER